MVNRERNEASFVIMGEPQGKGRPRFSVAGGHVKTRTPEKTASYENLIRVEYMRQCGDFRFDDNDMLGVEILAVYGVPKSDSKKKALEKEDGDLRPTKKPDMDNVMKVVADALNGYAYRDDTQIVDAMVRKFYGKIPFVKVVVFKVKKTSVVTKIVQYIKSLFDSKSKTREEKLQ